MARRFPVDDATVLAMRLDDVVTEVGHWKMNDDAANTVVADSSYDNNVGASVRNTSLMSVSGKINTALQFNGSTDVVTVPDDPSLAIGTKLSISVWFKRTSLTNYCPMVWRGGDWNVGSCNYALAIHSTANQNNGGYFSYQGGGHYINGATVGINDLNWHHIVIVAVHGIVYVEWWVDGVYHNTAGTFGTSTVNLNSGISAPVNIGAAFDPHVSYPYYSDITIDDARIWEGMISEQKIGELYNSGSGTEDSKVAALPVCVDLSVNALVPSYQVCNAFENYDTDIPFQYAMNFIRTFSAQALIVANDVALNLAAGGEITVECWARVEVYDTTGGIFVSKYNSGGNGGWALYYSSANGIVAALKSSGGTYETLNNSSVPTLDEWYYVAFTFINGGDLILYVNGVEANRITPTNVLADSTVDMWLGKWQSSSNYDLDGQVAEVRVSNRARFPWEIYNIWKAVTDPQLGLKP